MGNDDYGYRLAFRARGMRVYDSPVWAFALSLDNTCGRPSLSGVFWRWDWSIGWMLVRDDEPDPATASPSC
jgi:hypothetical protein